MKKIMFVAAMCSMVLSSCILQKRDKGEEKTVDYTLEAFRQVDLDGDYDVKYVVGDAYTVQLRGGENDLKDVKCTVTDGVLTIKQKRSLNIGGGSDIDITLTSPTLSVVNVYGACDFDAEQPFKTDIMEFNINGAGDVDIDALTCDTLMLSVSGAGDIEMNVSNAQYTDVTLSGAANVEMVMYDGGDVNCNISGAGMIELKGDVRSVQKTISGMGKVNMDKLNIN